VDHQELQIQVWDIQDHLVTAAEEEQEELLETLMVDQERLPQSQALLLLEVAVEQTVMVVEQELEALAVEATDLVMKQTETLVKPIQAAAVVVDSGEDLLAVQEFVL
jgi:fructose/tagatose bisphosphate aldolase